MPRPLALLALLILLAHAAVNAQDSPLHCEFRRLGQGTQTRLLFELHNPGPQTWTLLRWGSPFEGGWFGRFLRAWQDGRELPYQGALVKRGEPELADYLTLAPGRRLRAELELAQGFDVGAGAPPRLEASWTWIDAGTALRPPRSRERHQAMAQRCSERRPD